MSYQGVADLLQSLLHPVCQTAVYNNVQAAGKRVHQLRKAWQKQQAGQIKGLGLDFTHVDCNGQDQIVAVATAILTGEPIDIELIEAEASVRILHWIREIAEEIGAEVIVTDDADALETFAARYQMAPPLPQDHRASLWYRMRRLTLDWSENWSRLALYRRWRGAHGEKLDGTNNVTEQIIGNSIMERNRTMRGYKRKESIRTVSSLIAWARAKGADYDLGEVVAN